MQNEKKGCGCGQKKEQKSSCCGSKKDDALIKEQARGSTKAGGTEP